MKKLNKKAAAGIGLGALALVGGTFAYYSQTASLDNPLSTGRYTTQLVEDYTPPTEDLKPGAKWDKNVGAENTGDYPVLVRISMKESWSYKGAADSYKTILSASDLFNNGTYAGGIFDAAVAAFVFLGGTQRLASVVEKIVPIMAGVYIVGSLILIIMNITNLPAAIKMIFVGAFDPQAVLGAGAGIAVKEAIRFGVARGLFSNEAGMGSTPHAHARATAENPHKQGLCAMISVFIDTFVILNLTVFSVLTTGALESGKNGTALTQAAFMKGFGTFGIVFVAVCLLFFAFSTILGWHFFGLINAKYLFGDKAAKVYSLLVVACIIIGSALKLELVWDLADFFNGLMVIPNAMALLALSGLVVKICNKYSDK